VAVSTAKPSHFATVATLIYKLRHSALRAAAFKPGVDWLFGCLSRNRLDFAALAGRYSALQNFGFLITLRAAL
jgi:hypothetical protein